MSSSSSTGHNPTTQLQEIDDVSRSLIVKINKGDSTLIGELLKKHKFDVNGYFFSKLDKHVTLLYRAAQRNNVDVARELLKQPGIDVNKETGSHKTPLYSAAREGHLEIVKMLLANPIIDINKQNEENSVCPFYLAVQNGHFEVVLQFLSRSDIDVNNARSTGSTPIYITTKFGHLEIVKELLKRSGIHVNKALTPNLGGETPLYVACKQGFAEIVKCLLDYPEIDVNQRLFKNSRLGQYENPAEYEEHEEFVVQDVSGKNVEYDSDSSLLTYEQFQQVEGQGQTTLSRICGYSQHIKKTEGWNFFAEGQGSRDLENNEDADDNDLVKLLRIHEVQIVQRSTRTERCVIVRPTVSTLCGIVRILLNDKNIDMEIRDDEGKMAIFHACKYGHAKFVELLLEYGANVNQICQKRSFYHKDFFIEQGTVLFDALVCDIERYEKLQALFQRLDLSPNQVSQYYVKSSENEEICVSGNILIGSVLLGLKDDDNSYLKKVIQAISKSTHSLNIEVTWLHKSQFGNEVQLDISTQKRESILDFLIKRNKISLVFDLFQALLNGQIKVDQTHYFVEAFPSMSGEEGFHPILANFVEHEHLVVQRVGEQSKKEQQQLWGLLGGVPYIANLVSQATDYNIFRSIFVNAAVEFQWTKQTKLYYRSQFGVFLVYLILFLAAISIHLDWNLQTATEQYVGVRPILWATLPLVILMICSEVFQPNYTLLSCKNWSLFDHFTGLIFDLFQIQTVANVLDWFIIVVGFLLPFLWSRDNETLMSFTAIHIVVLFFRLTIWLLPSRALGHYILMMVLITWKTFMFIVVICFMLLFFTISFMVLLQQSEHSKEFFKQLFVMSQGLFGDIEFDTFYKLNSPAKEIGLALRALFILIIPIISINLLIALMTSIYEDVARQREATYIRNRALIALEANQVYDNLVKIFPYFESEKKQLNFEQFEQLKKQLNYGVGGISNLQDLFQENFSRIDKQYLDVQKQLLEISKEQVAISQKLRFIQKNFEQKHE